MAFPDSAQVGELHLERASDEVWQRAQLDDFVIFTRDADFLDIANLRGAPPKVLLLRAGNLSTAAIHALVRPLIGALAEALHGSKLGVAIEASGGSLRPH